MLLANTLGHEQTGRQAANFKDAAWRFGWRLGKITIDLYWPLTLDARCGHPFKLGRDCNMISCDHESPSQERSIPDLTKEAMVQHSTRIYFLHILEWTKRKRLCSAPRNQEALLTRKVKWVKCCTFKRRPTRWRLNDAIHNFMTSHRKIIQSLNCRLNEASKLETVDGQSTDYVRRTHEISNRSVYIQFW